MNSRKDTTMTCVERGRSSVESRFSSLFGPEKCLRPSYDTILLEESDCLVVPTLGSILPNWLLIIPRYQASNFAEWSLATGRQPSDIAGKVISRMGITPMRAVWFEHGAVQTGSSIGCGVDHAHLHLLIDAPFSFTEFEQQARRSCELSWLDVPVAAAYHRIPIGSSYLLAWSLDRAILAQEVETVGSQFFRRVVAHLAGYPASWDYKLYPHIENVMRTINRFGTETR